MTLRMPNKHFLRHCRGRLITNKEWIRNFESAFASLIWLKLSILSYGWCMTRWRLPENFIDDPEALFRKTRAKLRSSTLQRIASSKPEDRRSFIRNLSTEFEAMANKSIREFSAPTTDNIRTRPTVEIDRNFELKPGLINMVQAN